VLHEKKKGKAKKGRGAILKGGPRAPRRKSGRLVVESGVEKGVWEGRRWAGGGQSEKGEFV